MSSVACCWSMAGEGTVPPMALLVLPLDGMPLWVMIYFLEAINTREWAFCGIFWVGWEGDLEYKLNSQ